MKERTALKRITSILLTIVLMVGLLPTAVFSASAADVQEVSTYEALVVAAELGGEIKLTGNIELEDTVLVYNAETTLDLNGYTMSLNDPEKFYALAVLGAVLTIKDSSPAGTGTISMQGNSQSSAILVTGEIGELYIRGGIIKSGANAVYHQGKVLEITGGVFDGETTSLFVESGVGAPSIKGGRFSSDPSAYLADGYAANYNESTGYYDVTEEERVPEVIYFDIEGSDVDSKTVAAHFYDAIGGYLSSDMMDLVEGTICLCNVPDGAVEVYFDYVTDSLGTSYTEMLVLPTDGMNLYSLATDEWSTYVPEPVAWNDTDDDGVIDDGETTYITLTYALLAGGTVKLARDYDASGVDGLILRGAETAPIVATLDLNGYAITATANYFFDIYEYYTLTVTDTSTAGTGSVTITGNDVFYCKSDTSSLIVKAGRFTSLAEVLVVERGSATVMGGTFVAQGAGTKTIFANATGTSVSITGGSFSTDPTYYLTDDYKATYNESTGYYDVTENVTDTTVVAWSDTDDDGVIDEGETTYATLEDALLAGGAVKLAEDVSIRARIALEHGSATLDLNGYTVTVFAPRFIEVMGSATLTVLDTSADGLGTVVPWDDTVEDLFLIGNAGATLTVYGGIFTTGMLDVFFVEGGAVNVYGGTYHTLGSVLGLCDLISGTILLYGGAFETDPSSYVANGYGVTFNEITGYYDVTEENRVPEVIYVDTEGSDAGSEFVVASFYDAVSSYVGSETMDLVEEMIWSCNVPDGAVEVYFSYSTDSLDTSYTEMLVLPTDGANLYVFATDEWSTYVPEPEPVAWNDTDDDGVIDEGETTYATLEDALFAGGTVKLARDYDASAEGNLSLSGTETAPILATLDLNGYAITTTGKYIFDIYEYYTLTVTDTSTAGTGSVTITGNDVFYCKSDTSFLTVQAGRFTSLKEVLMVERGSATIMGGTFVAQNADTKAIFVNATGTSISITGGSFSTDPTYYLTDDYKATYNESTGYYDVSEEITASTGKIVIEMTDSYGDGWNGAKITVYKDGELVAEATVDGDWNTLELEYDSEAEYEFFWVPGSYDSECSYSIFIDGVEYTEELLSDPYVPRFTDMSFNTDSTGYDADTKIFTVTEENPFILTVSGENLDKLDLTDHNAIPCIYLYTDFGNFLPILTFTQPTSASENELVFTLTGDVIVQTAEFGEIISIIYTHDGQTVDASIEVSLQLPSYAITATSGERGTVTVDSEASMGRIVEISVHPDEGYTLDTLTVTDANGAVSVKHEGGNTYSFQMPDGEVSVNATFRAAEKYTVTMTDTEHATVTVAEEAYEDSYVTVTVLPELGYRVDQVLVTYGADGLLVAEPMEDSTTEYRFFMPAADVTVTVEVIQTAVITDMYVPEGTPGYDPVTKEFVLTPKHPFHFVMEGMNFDQMPDDWQILVGGWNSDTVIAGFIKTSDGSMTDTKATIHYDFDAFLHVMHWVDGSYVGKIVDFYDEYQPSDVKLYYSYVTVEQSENGHVYVPHSLNPGDTAVITLTPDDGYALETLTVTDASGNPVEVVDNSFTVPEGGATVTATFYLSHTHSYSGYEYDETGHWQVCDCGHATEVEEHSLNEATHTSNSKCSVCGYLDALALGHTYSEEYFSDEHEHWRECDCGVRWSSKEHTFEEIASEATKKEDATCTTLAVYYKSCSVCARLSTETFTYGETVDHTFGEYTPNGDATCTEDGTKTATCEHCDATDTVADEGSATGHTFGEYTPNGDATCTEDGTKTATCEHCDATDTVADEGSATGHTFGEYTPNGDATCTEDGTKTAKCEHCDATDTVADEGSATGHTYGAYTSDGNATCTEDGTKTAKCEHCDATDTVTDTGSKKGHTYDKGSCTVCGAEDPDYTNLTGLWVGLGVVAVAGCGTGGFFLLRKKKK
ncbi:MAG: hypothetical protein J6D21_09285 [Clostridia bacterium]|nr:hypothetical protein [Clostridia bacterium]